MMTEGGMTKSRLLNDLVYFLCYFPPVDRYMYWIISAFWKWCNSLKQIKHHRINILQMRKCWLKTWEWSKINLQRYPLFVGTDEESFSMKKLDDFSHQWHILLVHKNHYQCMFHHEIFWYYGHKTVQFQLFTNIMCNSMRLRYFSY